MQPPLPGLEDGDPGIGSPGGAEVERGTSRSRRPTECTLTRELTGWQPHHPGLIEDLEKGHYFHTT